VSSPSRFHLDAVATVVDAEAAHVALSLSTGLAQLLAADLIVVNKCDLVGLGPLADLEDRIGKLAPSIRVVRTRFGQAPLEAIMDVREVQPGSAAAAASHLQVKLSNLLYRSTSALSNLSFFSFFGAVLLMVRGSSGFSRTTPYQPRAERGKSEVCDVIFPPSFASVFPSL
jgi:G3E family GTPase